MYDLVRSVSQDYRSSHVLTPDKALEILSALGCFSHRVNQTCRTGTVLVEFARLCPKTTSICVCETAVLL